MSGRRRSNRHNSNPVSDFEIETRGTLSRTHALEINEQPIKLNFADFENILRQFSGDNSVSVKKWIAEFEQYAETFRLNEKQRFIFCKRSLCGAAKMYVEYEAKPLNYYDLKNALYIEFLPKFNSADIHKQLRERKKKSSESFREYLYIMIDIASQAEVDDASVISYVIDGIKEHPTNKMILYGAKTMTEFKEKLLTYEKLKLEINTQTGERYKEKAVDQMTIKRRNDARNTSVRKYCFNCGSTEHECNSCPQKDKGPKCFRCNKFGHKSSNCPVGKTSGSSTSTHLIVKSGMYVPVKVNGYPIEALVDTGSDICVVKKSLLQFINPKYLCRTARLTVTGLGANVTTEGSCLAEIEINQDIFENVELNLIQNNYMKPDLILGTDFLQAAVVQIEGGKVRIHKKKDITCKVNEEKEEGTLKSCFLAEIDVAGEYSGNFPDVSYLKGNVRKKVLTMIKNYKPEVPEESPIKMKIVPIDERPVYQSPRRFPPREQKIIEKQVQEWISNGIIRESTSDYASPVVLVQKKDSSYRLCIDFRAVNRRIHKDRYPLPVVEDQVDRLQGANWFTTLDLENGFFHVAIEEGSRKYTSFVTQQGQFEFLRVPFGLCNSPSVFQKFINYVLKDLINEGVVVVYIDDIVIPSTSVEEGITRLERVLKVAGKSGLHMKWKKCQILKEEIEYLGYVIKQGKLSPSPGKIKAVVNFPQPSNAKQVQSFLGLTGYFRKFVSNYSLIAKPLSDLLKKDTKFKFDIDQINSFNMLKQVLTTKPTLKIFRYGDHTELHTDASKYGYGAMLEVLAIVEAVKKFRVYLMGQHFKLVTDCQAFQMTLKKRDLVTRVARWALLLEDYSYEVEHRVGSKMSHVDALSRNPISMGIAVENDFLNKVRDMQKKDERLNAIMELLKQGPYNDYVLHHGILCKKVEDKLLYVVPDKLKSSIVQHVHQQGHFHHKKMSEVIQKEFFIPDLKKRIDNCIANCVKCILAERKTGKPESLLNPIPKGDRPLDTLHLDHLGSLTMTKKGYRYILAIVDGFTKFCWLFPTKTLGSEEVIQKYEIVAETFGYPSRIISDRGGAFQSSNFREYCSSHDIKLYFITAGIPRGNGQVERLHSVVITALTKLSLEDAEKWYSHLKALQRILNSTFQRAIQMSPYELLTGTRMKTEKDIRLLQIIDEEYARNYCDERDELRKKAKTEIAKIQRENQQQHNKKRKKATQYKVKDVVAIERTQFSTGLKIKPKFLGPYEVVKVKGHDRYGVEKVGNGEGPKNTTTSADKMKYWCEDDDEGEILDDNDENNDDIDEEHTKDSNDGNNVEQEYSSDTEELSGVAECGALSNGRIP